MADGSISRRYAQALVDLGKEGNVVARIADDLATVGEVLDTADGLLRDALLNPGLAVAERKGVLEAVLAKLELHAHVANFLRLLIDNQRFGALPGIVRAYDGMADDLANRVRATVTTASELSPAMAADVQAALEKATGKTVQISFETDTALIGGMVAQVGDTVYDASVRARLAEIQQKLISGTAAAEA